MTENISETNTPAEKPLAIQNNPPKQKLPLRYVFFASGTIALLLIGFVFGQRFERERIRHFTNWGNNYKNNFANNPPRSPREMMRFSMPPDSFRSHSILGSILSSDKNGFSIQADDSTEQSVLITSRTTIRNGFNTIGAENLKNGQHVAVFGQPNNQGQIEASLVRIFDDGSPKTTITPAISPQQKN